MKEFRGYQKGINLGGWLSQCDHTENHYETFITESDIKQIAEWGLDHVRLPIDYELLKTKEGETIPSHFTYIDNCIAWCKKYHLHMILDLHKTAGYSFDENKNSFFDEESLQDLFVALWVELAKRYGSLDNQIAFELLNEVVEERVCVVWNSIIKRTLSAIRPFAPKMKVLTGGVKYNSVFSVGSLDLPYDENIVYTFHFYEPIIFTHQSAYWIDEMDTQFSVEYPGDFTTYLAKSKQYLPAVHHEFYTHLKTRKMDQSYIRDAFADAIAVAEERNVPLYCGEYGVIDRVSMDSTLNWYTDIHQVFEEFHIGRAAWTYKEKDFGLIGAHYDSIRGKLVGLL